MSFLVCIWSRHQLLHLPAFNFELILSVKYIVFDRFQSNWHDPGNFFNPYAGCMRYTILVISQLATTTQDTGCRASEYAILTGFLPKKAEGVLMTSSMVGPIDFCLDCRCSCHPILFQTGEHNGHRGQSTSLLMLSRFPRFPGPQRASRTEQRADIYRTAYTFGLIFVCFLSWQ